MVMEIPTPQCVGREFVRQYYTLLNKAPLHLHRFYNHDSSFLHGGLDRPGQETRPVVGQQDIHERIMQLNFRDCHAKIRQVDSLETLGDGVVVQVSGELSNNGQPMRRFMQTFVLVPQSPKKYYVRNDIFRYQDEIFTEDDNDLDVEESVTRNSGCLDQDDNVGYHDNDIVRNGSAYSNDSVVVTPKYVPPPAPQLVASPPPPEVVEVDSAKSDWEDEDEPEEEEEELEDELGRGGGHDHLIEEVVPAEAPDASPPAVVSQEPKTYANMVSKNTSGSIAPPISNAVSPVTPPHKAEPHAPPAFHKEGSRDKSEPACPTFGSHPGPRPSRPRLNSGRGMGGPRFEVGRESNDGPARSPPEGGDQDADRRSLGINKAFVHYPDSQQLFVGNLTHSITEEELKMHFTQFGRVLDMRINTKQTQKIGGGKVPNFGFIVFDDAEAVQKVLGARPIYFNDHRLNVEEKKRPKDTRVVPPPPPRSGPSPRVGAGGPRGGGGGPRGGMRGGYASRR